jgi:Tfp pilus assembly pilus retraction ATPase PilT
MKRRRPSLLSKKSMNLHLSSEQVSLFSSNHSDHPEAETADTPWKGQFPHLHEWLDAACGRGGLMLIAGVTGSAKSASLQRAIMALERSGTTLCVLDNQEFEDLEVEQLPAERFIVVPEIRTAEQAKMAAGLVRAGRTVLSTIHAANTLAAYARLQGFSLSGAALRESLGGILAQRLAWDATFEKFTLYGGGANKVPVSELAIFDSPLMYERFERGEGPLRTMQQDIEEKIEAGLVYPEEGWRVVTARTTRTTTTANVLRSLGY